MEVAALGLKIEGVEGIDRAAASLDGLAAAGVKAESSSKGLAAAAQITAAAERDFASASAQAGSSTKRLSEFIDSSIASQRSLDSALHKLSDTLDKLSESYRKIPKEIPAPKLPPVVVPPEVPKALTDLEKRAAAAGMSVGAMSAALRGVPAQFTDIAVSLQGGMSPLTVFLQQGGQLKDMFGGAGNAARALGGYVLGLINPFSVAAAAAAALGVAYFQGSKEQDAFMVSMAKTGNSAGVTTSSLKAYAEQISDTVGTQGKAAESLNIFIDSGVKAGSSLARLTETAIAWEKATGEGVDKVAAKYVALQNDPLKAALKLNEGMNFLTLSVYEQISALEDQGKTTDAAKVAMDALDKAMADRSKTIEENLGSIQRAWNGITGAAKTAWDAMLNIGRPSSINDQLLDVEKQLERLMGTQGFGETEGGAATGRVSAGQQAKIRESIRALQDRKAALMGQAEAERWSADATKKNSEAVAAKAAWDKIVNATLSKSEKLELALAKVRETAAAAGITGLELEKQLNAERKKYAETTKKATGEFKTFLTSIEAKIAANEAELFAAGKLTESAKLQIELDTKVKTGKFKLSDAQKELAKDSIKRLADQEKEQKAIARSIALNDERIASEEEMNKALAEMDRQVNQVKIATSEYNQSVSDQIEMTELETKTIGMNAQARQVLIEQLRIEQDLRKRRDAIKDAPFASDESKQYELGRLDAAGARAMALAQRKVYVAEWEKTSQLIGDTLADYIMGGGKDAATYLKRLFATLVLQPVVKYGVQGALNSLGMGQGQGAAAGGSAAGMPGGGLTDWSSWGTNASNWLSDQGISAIGNGWSEVGSGLHNLGQTIQGVDTFIKDLPGMSGGIGSAAGYLGAIYSLSQGKVGSAAGTAIGNWALPGIGTMIGGVLGGLLDGLDDSGTQHKGAGAIYSKVTGVQSGAGIYNQGSFGMGHRDEYSAEMQAGISGIAQGLGQTLDAFAISFGKTAGYSVATAFADDSSKDGSWGSLKIADALGNVLVNWEDSRSSKWAPKTFGDGEEGYKEFMNTVAVDVKNAFLAMDLGAWANQILNTATDIDTLNAALQQIATVKTVFDGLGKTMSIFADLTGDAQTRLLAASGSIDALASNASSFYEGFYSEGERAQKQRELQMQALSNAGLYIDPYQGDAAKEMFRKTVEEAMSSGQSELAAQLLAMSAAFGKTAEYGQNILDATAEAAKNAAEIAENEAKKAAAEMMEAIEKAQASAKAIADERYSLENSYLQVVGETDELRARELNTLDASNRELQKMIWARQDEAEAASKAAQKMADTQKAIDSVTGSFSGLRETITLDQLGTDENKYGYFKAQADSLTRMLPQLQDQEAITRAVNEIQSLTSRAYGSLDAEQKLEMGDEFLQYLAKTEDLALKNIERTNKDQADATGKAVGDAVAKEVGRIVDAITRLASDSGELSRETVEAIRRLSTQTGSTVVGAGQKYAEVNA